MFYQLSLDELLYCIRIGQQRQTTNIRNNIQSKQFTKRDPTFIHIQGVLGELSFAKLCNRELKHEIKREMNETNVQSETDVQSILNNTSSRGAKKDSFDWTLFGKTIDVKTTLNPYSKNIYARFHKYTNPADYYVLIFVKVFDIASGQQILVQTKYYDQLFGMILANPSAYRTEGEFQGFTPKEIMFHEKSHLQDGSFCAPINSSWEKFITEITKKRSNENL